MKRNHAFYLVSRVAITAALLLVPAAQVSADQFDDQINAVKNQVAQQQATAATLHAQVNDARSKIADLNGQISVLQNQIYLNQLEADKLGSEIAQAERDMTSQQAALAEDIKQMYVAGGTTPLEMIASSKNLSEFFDAQQYQDTIKNKIVDSMASITKLKAQLTSQKQELDSRLADQQNQRNELAQQKAAAAALEALAESNASAADQQVKAGDAQIAKLRAQQAAAIAAASHHIGGSSAGCGGYPSSWCNAPQDSILDSWGMYNRECVSYAAWYVAATGRHMPYWGGHGNANQWPNNARAAGISVDHTPRVGDVAIWMGGTYGHAMVVQEIKSSTVIVSSYNADNTGHYSVDEWNTGSLVFIHF